MAPPRSAMARVPGPGGRRPEGHAFRPPGDSTGLLAAVAVRVDRPARTLAALLLPTLGGSRSRPGLRLRLGGAPVERGCGLVPGLLERVGRRSERRGILALEELAHPRERLLDAGLERAVQLGPVLLQVLLDLVGQGVGPVAALDRLLALAILGRMGLRVLDHAL